jgi:farnesyl-diphosphate farnesyltransferase
MLANSTHPPETTMTTRRDDDTIPLIDRAAGVATSFLLRELEAIAARLGELPDERIGGPALRMLRAITATDMRPGIAARMTIGRRWLAHDGIPRLVGPCTAPRAFATTDLAELVLVLLDGPVPLDERIEGEERARDGLLARQREDGSFGASDEPDSTRTTALSCRALAALGRRLDGASRARVDDALARAAAVLLGAQRADGAFVCRPGGHALAETAAAMEALAATGVGAARPAIARAREWLVAQLRSDGSFRAAENDEGAALSSTADALRALVRSEAAGSRAAAAAAGYLAGALLCACEDARDLAPTFAARTLAPGAPALWAAGADGLEALGLFDRATAGRALGGPQSAEARTGAAPVGDADWRRCREHLTQVSRSFSRPIALLPHHLEIAVTLGYLLCRVADTIEDHPDVPPSSREALFACFLDVLHGRRAPDVLAAAFDELPGADAELALARDVATAMRVFRAQPASTRASSVRWIAELARGMALYAHREPGRDGLVALSTLGDLERYCYFVAGTVGHFLTDLFLEELGDGATPALATKLRVLAEPFATGLQLVNILKDLVADQARGLSFVPRTAYGLHGLEPRDLGDPARRTAARAALAPLFGLARRSLDDGVRYALSIPPRHVELRRFCLVPLFMAARTLVAARGGDAIFTPGAPLKIPRAETEALVLACVEHAADDEELGARYVALWADVPSRHDRRSAG